MFMNQEPLLLKRTLLFYQEPTNAIYNKQAAQITQLLGGEVKQLVTGAGSQNDPKYFSNPYSRHLAALRAGKLKVALQRSDTAFIRLDIGPHHFGRQLATPFNFFVQKNYPGRHYLDIEANRIPAKGLTGLYCNDNLIDAYESVTVYQLGGITGFSHIELTEGRAYVEEIVEEGGEDLELSLWYFKSIHTYRPRLGVSVFGSADAGSVNSCGDSSGPIFDKAALSWVISIKRHWKKFNIGVFVPWY
jgi:hypothetical protein